MSRRFYAKRNWNLRARRQRSPGGAAFFKRLAIRLADFASGKTEEGRWHQFPAALSRNFRVLALFHHLKKPLRPWEGHSGFCEVSLVPRLLRINSSNRRNDFLGNA